MKFHKVQYNQYIKLRIIATIIDLLIYFSAIGIYVYCFGTPNDNGGITLIGLPTFVIMIFWFIYFVVTEALNQATPGHDICKLIVVKSYGGKISFWDAFKRRLVDPIDIFFYGIPALILIYKTPMHQRLGDLLADTVVVKKSDILETEVKF